jgi:ElaB/YqjD/DUF883 family membrane-anchored ribosome-binding protein
MEDVSDQLREGSDEVARLGAPASRVIDNGMSAARRLSKRGRDVAEDLMGVATERIQKDPLRSVATIMAIGFGVGALTGWLAKRVARQ